MTTTELMLVVDNDVTRAVTEQAMSWPEKARALAVVDQAAYAEAGELLGGIKALRREVDAAFDDIIAAAHRSHKTAVAKKQQAEAPLLQAEAILKQAMATFYQQEATRRREEELQRQEEARRREETRRLDEAAALEREAHATANADLQAEAEALLDQPVYVPPAPLAPAVQKVAGVSHRETWSAQLVNLDTLIKFVAAHPEHTNLLTFNQTAANQLARSMKGNLKVDGVRALNTPVVAAR